jgi:hypothetical protein
MFITDFVSGTDKLRVTDLSSDLPAGALNPNAFVTGTAAGDFDDRFIYDPVSGLLAYDRDGAGPLGLSYIAGFFPGTTLTAADIIIA